MANTFKVKTFGGGSTNANTAMTVYTAPSSTSTTIIGLTIANIIATQVLVSVQLENNDGNNVYLIKDAPISSGGSFVPIGGDQKVVMEASDILKVTSNTANSVDSTLSILEIT
ncbi:hypothetical protein OAC87_04070 [Pseudomonadales bacterium]|jgi:hypothetical protein|nr:hypothetical protein [Pseudomonadales bacterium]|tara:strand:- start:544 stop:882 length:339 start_codon:yes stop_codon:yes gene_type:complete